MGISKASLLSLAAAGIVPAGCQSSRFGNLDTVSPPPPPPPVNAAPAGSVQKGNLNSPNASQFPTAPTTDPNAQPGTQVASLPPASAPDLTPGSVAGVWNASLGGQSCKIATPQTKYGQGYRAGPLRCPGELGNLASRPSTASSSFSMMRMAAPSRRSILRDRAASTDRLQAGRPCRFRAKTFFRLKTGGSSRDGPPFLQLKG